MDQIVHVANTDFEFELADSREVPLEVSWSRHPLCLQLQFLPLFYASREDIVAVTAMPEKGFIESLQCTGLWPEGLPQFALLGEEPSFCGKLCVSWGPSKAVQAWAQSCAAHYDFPNWEVVKHVNSKAFSFSYSVLSEAVLIESDEALCEWLQRVRGPKVLKTCYGLSGIGNRRICSDAPTPEILAFCKKEWQKKRPLIGEPWLDRLCDFSTQWLIKKGGKIEYLGATRFETDANGVYVGTAAGPESLLFQPFLPHLTAQRKIAQKVLEDMANLGFFGPVGIDALLYRRAEDSEICLYPIVEINGRKTMSSVALSMQQRLCPKTMLRFVFCNSNSSQPPLLPAQLKDVKGRIVRFSKNLIVSQNQEL